MSKGSPEAIELTGFRLSRHPGLRSGTEWQKIDMLTFYEFISVDCTSFFVSVIDISNLEFTLRLAQGGELVEPFVIWCL